MNLSSKLASNNKLTSDKHKKHFENNLCIYCGAGDHKQELQCFSNCWSSGSCFQETLRKIESDP